MDSGLIVNGLLIAFTGNFRSTRTGYATQTIALGGVRIPYGRLIAFGLSVLLTLALVLFIRNTTMGLAIRATGMDRNAARLMGMNVRHVYAVTFGIATALAAAAGAMIGLVGTAAVGGGEGARLAAAGALPRRVDGRAAPGRDGAATATDSLTTGRGLTIVVVEHVMRTIRDVCDTVLVMHEGRELLTGQPKQVLDDDRIIEAYLGKRYAERHRAQRARGVRPGREEDEDARGR